MSKILVIDDSPTVREMMRQTLENAGYEVVLAGDGAAGLDIQKAQPCDVVITDLLMPEKEGLETIMDIQRETPGVPIIAVSGGSVMLDKRQLLKAAEQLGASCTMRKPIKMQELLHKVANFAGA